jgi:hypothetical protein
MIGRHNGFVRWGGEVSAAWVAEPTDLDVAGFVQILASLTGATVSTDLISTMTFALDHQIRVKACIRIAS